MQSVVSGLNQMRQFGVVVVHFVIESKDLLKSAVVIIQHQLSSVLPWY